MERLSELTTKEKLDAIRHMGTYCLDHDLPLPQSISMYLSYKISASTHLWEFEAKVPFIENESREDLDKRRREWLQNWIRDIARKVTGSRVEVKKDWSADFSITLTNKAENWEIVYSVRRDVVCEKKITGKKIVPERVIPEREEEEFEWICNDKSLLGNGEEGKE